MRTLTINNIKFEEASTQTNWDNLMASDHFTELFRFLPNQNKNRNFTLTDEKQIQPNVSKPLIIWFKGSDDVKFWMLESEYDYIKTLEDKDIVMFACISGCYKKGETIDGYTIKVGYNNKITANV